MGEPEEGHIIIGALNGKREAKVKLVMFSQKT